MTEEKPKALVVFEEEIESIKNVEIQAFVNNVLAIAPASYAADEKLIELVKKAYKIIKHMLTKNKVDENAIEMISSVVLIARILKNEFKDTNYPMIYTMATREFIKKHNEDSVLPTNVFENLMHAIECNEGQEGISVSIHPKNGTVEAEVSNAFIMAELL